MPVVHSHYSQSPEEVSAARGTTARSTSLDIRGVETVHSQCRFVGLNRKISNCSEAETAERDQPSVISPSTDRNIFPSEPSQAACATPVIRPITDAQAIKMMGGGVRIQFCAQHDISQSDPYGLRSVCVLDDLTFRTAYVLCSARTGAMSESFAMVRRGNIWVHGCIEWAEDDMGYGNKDCIGEFRS